jgi:hypothetical protein
MYPAWRMKRCSCNLGPFGVACELPDRESVASATLIAFLSAILLFSLSGCRGQTDNLPNGPSGQAPYLPPTADVTHTSTPAIPLVQTQPPARPSPTPPCSSDLEFLEDLTLPDGAMVSPGERLDKRWLVKNSGSCNWDETYRLRLVAGPSLGAETEQALYPARSGAEATIRIFFTAPTEPGVYRSAWQAYTPLGEAFGELFFVEFVVP